MAINTNTIDEYKKINWTNLLRGDLGKAGNLEEVKDNFDRIKDIFDKLFQYQNTLNQIPNYERVFESVLAQFTQGVNGNILNGYSDVSQRPQKCAYVRQIEESYVSQLTPIFSYLQFADPLNKIQTKDFEKKRKELDQKVIEIDELSKRLEGAVNLSAKISEGQEIEKYGNEFGDMAEKINKVNAKRNHQLMYLFILLTSFLACVFVFGHQKQIISEELSIFVIWNFVLEQNILIKIILISAGGYLVSHFSRNYSAEMHMYYINKHRQLSLNSHQRVLDSVRTTETQNDLETKNALLLQVAKTMFDIQETGYLKFADSNPVPSAQIIETVRSGLSRNN